MEVLDKDGLDYFWDKIKNYIDSNINSLKSIDIPIGSIVAYPGKIAPEGWHLCDGSHLLVESYPELFNVIGYTYGNTLGDDYLDLPNLKGKIIITYDNGDTDFNMLGATGGSKTHTQTVNEMPSHNHGINGYSGGGGTNGVQAYDSKNANGTLFYTTATGKGQPMDIMNPYIVLNYIIKVKPTEV